MADSDTQNVANTQNCSDMDIENSDHCYILLLDKLTIYSLDT